MIDRILCFLGFHKWADWHIWLFREADGQITYRRICTRSKCITYQTSKYFKKLRVETHQP